MAYGAGARSIQLADWFLSKWAPDPAFQPLRGTLETALLSLWGELQAFGPAPSVPSGPTGLPVSPPPPPPPTGPEFVKPSGVVYPLTCPIGYDLTSNTAASRLGHGRWYTCVLAGTPTPPVGYYQPPLDDLALGL